MSSYLVSIVNFRRKLLHSSSWLTWVHWALQAWAGACWRRRCWGGRRCRTSRIKCYLCMRADKILSMEEISTDIKIHFGGLMRRHLRATVQRMATMQQRAMPIPFQFLWSGFDEISSWRNISQGSWYGPFEIHQILVFGKFSSFSVWWDACRSHRFVNKWSRPFTTKPHSAFSRRFSLETQQMILDFPRKSFVKTTFCTFRECFHIKLNKQSCFENCIPVSYEISLTWYSTFMFPPNW